MREGTNMKLPGGKRLDKADARYEPNGGDAKRRCENCSMFERPAGCTLVRGYISPGAVCKFWRARRAGGNDGK